LIRRAIHNTLFQFVRAFICCNRNALAVCLLGALLGISSVSLAQNHKLVIQNGATFNGIGKITVKDSIRNSNSSVPTIITSNVVLSGAAQGIVTNASNGSLQVDTLSVRGSGIKTIVGTIAVAESLDVLSGTTLNISNDTLRIGNNFVNAGTITTNTNSVVEYIRNTGSTQSISGGAFQGKTRLLNNTRKSLLGVLTVDSLEQSGWGLTVNSNLTVNGKAKIDSLINVTGGTTLSVGINNSTIATLQANAGIIRENSTGTLTFTNAAASNGTITNISTGTVTFANNLTGTGTVSQTANGTMNVGGSFTQNTYTLTGGTVVYNGTAAQSVIGGITYNNLTIATTGGNATASAAITLTGNLVINLGSTLDMAGFAASVFPGASNNNAGAIRWSGSNVYVSGAGTTEFYSAAVGNVAAGTNYGILLFSGTGMKTFATAGTTTATGNVTINSGAQVTVNNGVTVQVNGDFSNGGNITNNGAVKVGL
jgi:fibronectin-binding autotransporter adhesin